MSTTGMDIIDWSALDADGRARTLSRPAMDTGGLEQAVSDIIARVRREGDRALVELGKELDGARLTTLRVGKEAVARAAAECDPALLDAIESAAQRIEAFHATGIPQGARMETAPGLVCESRYLPISPVGLYVPGGSAPLISTVLMLAIPARLAGCGQVVMCTPPGQDGGVNGALLTAASRCGIGDIFLAGGAQAIAAMAFGTESVPKCAKLFGPGNAWVTEAKQQVAATPEGAAQDLPAGPSEVLVIADASADAMAVCLDLLSQAEHGPDSQAILVSDSDRLLREVEAKVFGLGAGLPRADILSRSLQALRLIRVADMAAAMDISNAYAPEHLIINAQDADALAMRVTAAGSVFVGPWTPESLGDYCSGTNHVLPTYGYARAYGGLSVSDFMRRMTLQSATRRGLEITGPVAATLAAAEGLDAHRLAVEYRLNGELS